MKNILLMMLAAVMLSVGTLHATVFPGGGISAAGYAPGTIVDITWNSDLMTGQVDVGLWNGDTGTLEILAQGIDFGQGAYEWMIPADQSSGDRYRFVIRDAGNPRRLELSMGWITLGSPPPAVTSVEDIDYGSDIRCDPFPAGNEVRVSWKDRVVTSVEIIDLMHRVVLHQDVDANAGSVRLDVSKMASGLTFIRLRGPNGGIVATPLLITH